MPAWGEDESSEDYKRAISSVARDGHDGITVTGGEPTTHPAIGDILGHAKTLGLHVTLQTNGRRLRHAAFAEQIVRNVDIFAIALHGPNPDVHDAITTRPGSFEQTVAGVRNIVSSGTSVVGKVVLTSLNAEHVLATSRLMADLGFDICVFSYVHGVGNAGRNYDRIAVRYTDLWPQVKASLDFLKQRHLPAILESFPFCIVTGYEGLVAELGFLAGEFHVKFQGRELEDWGATRLGQKCKFDRCSDCSFDPLCEGVWKEYADLFGGEELRPRDDRRNFERFCDRLEGILGSGRGSNSPRTDLRR